MAVITKSCEQTEDINVELEGLTRAKEVLLTSTPGVSMQASTTADEPTNMDLGRDEELSQVDDANLSINNTSTTSSDTTINYQNISTDGMFDLNKIQSWTLPSIQRRTAELHRKVNTAKRRVSQYSSGRVNKSNSSTLSLPSTDKCNEFSTKQLVESLVRHTATEVLQTLATRRDC